MVDSNAANLSPLVSRERVGNAIGSALKLYVGRGRRYSVKQLSNGTGVKDRAIECALCDAASVDYRPLPLEAVISIARFLGADFTSEWLGLAGQGAFDIPDDDAPPAMRLAVEDAEDNAKLLRIAADNEIDARERPDVAAIGRREITRGMQLVRAARAA